MKLVTEADLNKTLAKNNDWVRFNYLEPGYVRMDNSLREMMVMSNEEALYRIGILETHGWTSV